MDSSLLNDITVEDRSILYYKKYHYRVTFHLEHANRTLFTDTPLEFDQRITALAKDWKRFDIIIPDKWDKQPIYNFIAWRAKHYHRKGKDNALLVNLASNHVKVYCNDLGIVPELEQLGFSPVVAKVNPSVPVGVKLFKTDPPHRYRTYFKAKRIDSDWKKSLDSFLTEYSDTIYPCEGLLKWSKRHPSNHPLINSSSTMNSTMITWSSWRDWYIQQSYFIDYDDPGIKLVLALMFGNEYLSKHFELKKK
jgi:hypothetical protein